MGTWVSEVQVHHSPAYQARRKESIPLLLGTAGGRRSGVSFTTVPSLSQSPCRLRNQAQTVQASLAKLETGPRSDSTPPELEGEGGNPGNAGCWQAEPQGLGRRVEAPGGEGAPGWERGRRNKISGGDCRSLGVQVRLRGWVKEQGWGQRSLDPGWTLAGPWLDTGVPDSS